MAPQLAYWEPEDRAFWAREGAQVARRNLLLSIAGAGRCRSRVWMVWSVVVVQLPRDRLPLQRQPAVLARGAAGPRRRDAAALLLVHGADVRRPHLDRAVDGRAARAGDRPRARRAGPDDRLPDVPAAGARRRHRRRQLRVEHGEHQLLLSDRPARATALGWNAGLGNLGVSLAQLAVPLVIGVALFGALGGAAADLDRRRRDARDLAAERRLRLGAADRAGRGSPRGCGMDDLAPVKRVVRGPGGDLPAQAQLDPVLALPRHASARSSASRPAFRCWRRPSSPASTSRPTRSSARCSARSPGRRAAGSPTASAARASRSASSRRWRWSSLVLLLRRGGGRTAGGFAAFLGAVLAAVRRQRRRQRRGVPDDSRGVHRRPAAGARRRRPDGEARALREGTLEGAARAGLRLGDRRLRRLLHPQGLRHRHGAHRRHRAPRSTRSSSSTLSCIGRHLVVLRAPRRGGRMLTAAACLAAQRSSSPVTRHRPNGSTP